MRRRPSPLVAPVRPPARRRTPTASSWRPRSPTTGEERIVGVRLGHRPRTALVPLDAVRLARVQAAGVGRALLARVLPDRRRDRPMATATDSAQPISNALYAAYGMVPRIPLLTCRAGPSGPRRFEPLPSGVAADRRSRRSPADRPDGDGHRRAGGRPSTRSTASCSASPIPVDHRYLRAESRRGWLYRGPDGAPCRLRLCDRGRSRGPGRGPRRRPHGPGPRPPRRPWSSRAARSRLWLPGTADRAVVAALAAGFRLDQFPVLLCWDRPFADFARYLPISPGLL